MSLPPPTAFQPPPATAAAPHRLHWTLRSLRISTVIYVLLGIGVLIAGVLGFAATLWAAGNVAPVRDLAESLARVIYGTKYGMFLYMGLFLGGSYAVHAVAETKPINAIAYAAWVVLLGLLIAPIVVGAITDAMGSLSFALNVSAAMLALGAVLSAFQRKVVQKPQDG